MNKKEIEELCSSYVTFKLITNNYTSDKLNMDKIEFIKENLIKIKDGKKEIVIQVKDVRMIEGLVL